MHRSYKILLLLALYTGLAVWEGCYFEDTCNCPPLEKPFFDYSALNVQTSSDSIPIVQGAFLELLISPDSVAFVAQHRETRRPPLGLMGMAYACSCVPEGAQGEKFGIIAINVYADRSFRASIPIDENLNSLFKMETVDVMGNRVFKPIDEIAEISGFQWEDDSKSILTEAVPDVTGRETPYRFTIEIVKENGERVMAETGAVYWTI